MRIVVIGNGAAGNAAALVAKKTKPSASVTIISDEQFPLYSPCVFPGYLADEISRKRVFLRSIADYGGASLKLLLGEKALRIDTTGKKVILREKELEYDSLVLALGSKPIVPPIKGVNLEGVYLLKTIAHADEIFRCGEGRAVIIGSGPIGVEISVALRKKGLEVYIIESEDRILPKLFDLRPADTIKNRLEGNGVKIFTSEKVVEIIGKKKVAGVRTDKREIDCSIVLLATGMKPRVELASEAGVEVGELGGILVDDYMQTNFSNIHACGDCVESKDLIIGKSSLNLLWVNAVAQGRIAGNNSVGMKRKKYPGSLNLVVMDIFGIPVASAGYPATILNQDVKEMEKCIGKNYCKFVLTKEGKIVGAQLIGDIKAMSGIFRLMQKKVPIGVVKQAITIRGLLSLNPWYLGLRKYL